MKMKSSALGLLAAAALMSDFGGPEVQLTGAMPASKKVRLKSKVYKAKQKRMRMQKESRKINRHD